VIGFSNVTQIEITDKNFLRQKTIFLISPKEPFNHSHFLLHVQLVFFHYKSPHVFKFIISLSYRKVVVIFWVSDEVT